MNKSEVSKDVDACKNKEDEKAGTCSSQVQGQTEVNASCTKESVSKNDVTVSDSGQSEKKEEDTAVIVKAKPVRKIFKAPVRINKIPQEILDDPQIKQAMSALPSNYNFEVHKTIWRIKEMKAKRVALQMPEGLFLFATVLCDIIEEFTDAETIILGNVTYGACCVDDVSAKALEADLLIHYGHSCLIPIDRMEKSVKLLYIFVDIKIDTAHCIETIKYNFPITTRLGLVSTIQFASTLQVVAAELRKAGYTITVPQIKPLSPGEVLGCTAPRIKDVDVLLSVSDGRFHLEAAMISNPNIPAYKYDPYDKKITLEKYDHKAMLQNRKNAIEKAKDAKLFAIIFSTLGRQGSQTVLETIRKRILSLKKECVTILCSEITPNMLKNYPQVDAFIQIACPRLSIDWGTQFEKPLLNPYETAVVLKMIEFDESNPYPMDYYSNSSLGPWTPNYKPDDLAKPSEICCGKCKDEKNTSRPCK